MPTSLEVAAVATFSALMLCTVQAALAEGAPTTAPLSPPTSRIEEIAAMLSPAPAGVGRAASDRQTWDAIGKTSPFEGIIAEAEENMAKPIPTITEDDFDSYDKTGRRERYSRALGALTKRLRTAVYAECVENRGRFIHDIELAVERLRELPTWVPPYHYGLWNRDENTTYVVDLTSSDIGAMLATADYWLGDKLPGQTRQSIRRELEQRILQPVRNKIDGGPGRTIWWLTGTNNWNAVCMANVVIAAMAVLPERNQRAYFIAAAEKVTQHYLRGFSAGGYCSEGLGYWNYGFGHYVMLADVIYQATGGKLDWLTDPHVRRVAMFGTRTEILPGVYPSIADASLRVRPMSDLQNYIVRKYGLDLPRWQRPIGAEAMRPDGLQQSIYAFPHGLASPQPAGGFQLDPGREWFEDAQFYIGRPGGGKARLGVALKGGHNDEHHNHNDVGTYLVAVGGETPLVDPGAPVYTRETFSSRRYEDKVINSWGHPVPLIDGNLQKTGPEAKATLLRKEFTDSQDTLVFDIKAAYGLPGIKSLTRKFIFSRREAGSLTVIDEAEFSTPSRFGTTFITYGDCNVEADGLLSVRQDEESVVVTIDTDGKPYELHQEHIESEVRSKRKPLRLGLDLAQPATSARITVRITPAEKAD